MSEMMQPQKVARDVIVTLDYQLTVDGEVIDSSMDTEPIVYLHGHGNILPGLEEALFGMRLEESKQVYLKARDAYGEFDEEAFVDVPRDEIPEDIPIEIGVELTVTDEDDEDVDAVIDEVNDDSVRLNLNHPLAGKDLKFDVTVIGLREATPEEIEHGHAHEDDEWDDEQDDVDLLDRADQ